MHQQERPAEAKLPKLDVQVAQVGDDAGCERGIYDGGRRALVLAHHRGERGRGRYPRIVAALPHVCRSLDLVLVVQEAVEERDSDRFHVFGLEGGQRGIDILSNERRVLAAVRIDATANAMSQVAWNQHGGKGLAMVPLILPEAAPDLERVAKSLGREKTDLCALSLEHPVGRDRRTVDEEGAVPKYILDRAVEIACQTLERSKNALAGVRRYRGHFDDATDGPTVGQDQIGERAADVDADTPGRLKGGKASNYPIPHDRCILMATGSRSAGKSVPALQPVVLRDDTARSRNDSLHELVVLGGSSGMRGPREGSATLCS